MAKRIRYKVYIDVAVLFSTEGTMTPLYLLWEDGRRFDIDRVLSVGREANKRAGGCGICYRCRILGQEAKLYYEENYKWFVEAKR